MTADTMPGTQRPAGKSVAERVKAQLEGDYPPGELSWVDDVIWSEPVSVPLGQFDRTAGVADWKAAAADKLKIQGMKKRIAAGFRKPVVVLRLPGKPRFFVVDGHSRITASTELG